MKNRISDVAKKYAPLMFDYAEAMAPNQQDSSGPCARRSVPSRTSGIYSS